MADKFFTQTTCDRCGGSLDKGRTMSVFNTDCICMQCKHAETQRPDYAAARDAEHAEVCKGNMNFAGVGMSHCGDCKYYEDDRHYCRLVMDIMDEDDEICSWFEKYEVKK